MMEQAPDPKMEAFMKEAFQREDIHRFKQMLKEVSYEVEAREAPKVIGIERKSNWTTWAVAASIAVLLGSVFYFMDSAPNGPELAMAALQDPRLATVRSGDVMDNTADSLKHELSLLIQKKNFEQFLVLSEENLSKTTRLGKHYNWARLYRSFSFLKIEDKADALKELDLLKDPSKLEAAQRDYYFALLALMNEDVPAAKGHLEKIQDAFPWDGRAKDLLEEL